MNKLINGGRVGAGQIELRYVNDDDPGYARKRWGRGFTYLDGEGNHIQDETLRGRFEELAIPPAWTEVWICIDPAGHIQATGRDDQGRKQYIYHPEWQRMQQETKFNRLVPFAEALPELRAEIDSELRRHGFPREKVLALVVSLLDETLIRIGNPEYALKHESFGMTTLRVEHLTVNGSTVQFTFTGKSGKQQEFTIQNRRLARQVGQCQQLPGQQLFRYEDEEGRLRDVTSTDVNAYLREKMGEAFSAKDFRTWGATVLAAEALVRQAAEGEERPVEKQIVAAVKEVAEALGNTPAVAREYYIDPVIWQAHEEGELLRAMRKQRKARKGLSKAETAVLKLLRKYR